MNKTCPSCGNITPSEARFCRRCGSPIRVADDDSEGVSPLAATMPLTDEGRTTDGLPVEDPRRPGPDTGRVNRADLDSLLRTTPARPAPPQPEQPPDLDPYKTITSFGQQTRTSSTQLDEQTRRGGDDAPAQHTHNSQNFDGSETLAYTNLNTQINQPPAQSHDAAEVSEEELTITVARPVHPVPFQGTQTPAAVTPLAPPSSGNLPPAAIAQPAPPQPPHAAAPRRKGRGIWYVAAAVGGIFLLLVTAAAVWLGLKYFRRNAPASVNINANAPADAAANQLFEEKMAEAESLLASGDLDGAIARLKEATQLDPTNAKAHRRLGDLLLDNGRRREAIEEFRAITNNDPRDAEAWRSLARAQLDESLYPDAAESYRRLIAVSGETGLGDNELLSYAEALRLSNRAEEARPLYERLTASASTDVAAAARQHLAELSASTTPTPSATPEIARAMPNQNRLEQSTPTPSATAQPTPTPAPTTAPTAPPTPPPALTSGDHFARGEQLWSSNRSAALGEFRAAAARGNADAYYYLGLSIVQGKSPTALQRAELGAALQYFQNAQRGGRFRAEARRYEDQLGKEFDRRRQQ